MNEKASPDNAVPIRDVSEQTGVNSVTLRAWERRYGLIKPLRTAKGHRLYRPEDIERVRQVQQWLARGVAVGQVRALLEEPDTRPEDEADSDDHWARHRSDIERYTAALNAPALEQRLAELSALYPPALLVDRCLDPVLTGLRTDPTFGSATRLAFLETELARYFASALYRQSPERRAPRLLLVDSGKTPDPAMPVILAHALGVNRWRVDCFGSIPFKECVYAVEQLQSDALVLFSDEAPPAHLAKTHRALVKQLDIPVWLVGRQVALCDDSLSEYCLGLNCGELLEGLQRQWNSHAKRT